MDKNYNIVFGSILSLGMISVAYFIASAVNNYTYYNRSIHVKGLSEKDVIADTGTWTLTISLAGDNVILLNQHAEAAKKLYVKAYSKQDFKKQKLK